ncbi:aldehyde-activating protein [Rhodobacter sp. TJ_12]|uniref:GFA family protein n=1 Tax=Rhodobacter sp. TJ_12 TaxID=2029399 RepID=UPI001CBA8962|nr:GFA family protein [Rhodobacter sp. TJ_12]MBZ4023704.1 aldehyde-activating protein [Rhodobacter sp. TJ_12]
MENLVRGQCLCGAVTFRISGQFERFFLCHCGRCRKDSGSAHSANLFSSTAKIDWVSGQENIRTFNVPGTRHIKCFCAACGSALPSYNSNDDVLVVPAGSVDSQIDILPEAHICYSNRAEWDDNLDTLAKIDGLPK